MAQAAAVQLMRNPDDILHANILFKSVFLESISGPHSASALYKFLENLFPVSKLLTIKQNSVVSALLAGHEAALYRKYDRHMYYYYLLLWALLMFVCMYVMYVSWWLL